MTTPLTWSRTPPTEGVGQYWHRGSPKSVAIIVEVIGRTVYFHGTGDWMDFSDFKDSAEWSGPLPEPEEGRE